MLYQIGVRFLSVAAVTTVLFFSRSQASGQHEVVSSIVRTRESAGASRNLAATGFTLGTGSLLTHSGAPQIPLTGDADGDGRADFLEIEPEGHRVEYAHMSASGKLNPTHTAATNFAGRLVTATCGAFSGVSGMDILGLCADGTVVVSSEMSVSTQIYLRKNTACTLRAGLLPKEPVRTVVADFDGDGKPDVLLAGADGTLLLLHNERGADKMPRFTPISIRELRLSGRRMAAGDLSGTGKATLVWIDADGKVQRASMDKALHFGHATPLTTASPDDGLAIGRFRGDKQADVIVGQRLLPAGDASHTIPLPNLPNAKQARADTVWIAADFNGDGKDDLLRALGGGDPLDPNRVLVYYSHDSHDRRSLQFDDTDNDGLPDAWETGDVHPGGLDLKAMGCSPDHADVIVEVQRMADVPEAPLRADMDKAVKYFAGLPVKNPDGSLGIALHVIYNDPIPVSEGGLGWGRLQGKYHAVNHRGITHWFAVYNGGGGQSSEMNDGGSFGRFGMPAVFIHEFGHQLGLDHTGRWRPGWCPTFPSLMNYAYNYQLNGKSENVGFSDGRLSSVVLNERHLDEYLPLPMDRISFLAGPPYYYRMKPASDGKGTLIDWNWNGVFGEKDISADINYGYSTHAGERHVVCKTYTAPAMTAISQGIESRLLLFYGMLAPGTPLPAVDFKAKDPSLSSDQPGRLCLRLWQGADPAPDGDKWSAEIVVEAAGVTGESTATTFERAVWIAYPTLTGIQIRRLILNIAGLPEIGPAALLPNSLGAQPTLTSLNGRIALLLWRDRTKPVSLRWMSLKNDQVTVSAETPLEFTSNVPVGATGGLDAEGKPALWIGLTQDQDRRRPSRWQIRALTAAPDGTLHPKLHFWADGENGQNRGFGRVTLLLEPDKAFGPEGRWYFLQRGGTEADLNQDYIGMRIADKTMNGGCLTRRYYDEWTNSRSAPGACWFRNDIALASRWFGDSPAYRDNNLYVGFFGRGIESEDMGDFDEFREIRDYGLAGSIRTINE